MSAPPRSVTAPAVLVLAGPTASGKTALSLAVAQRLGGEIVSMDSRQVYRGMDVGTAKATPAERARIPHHGLDLVDPDQRYSAGRFARDARGWIHDIQARGRLPLLVGGTGFFLRALLEPVFTEPPVDAERREALRAWLAAQPRDRLEVWTARLDPDRASLAAEGGPQRLSRTLEVALLTGRPLSAWHRTAPPEGDPIPALVVVLEIPREELDRRIAERVRRMMAAGLVAEVASLLAAGYPPTAPGMTGVGYREVAAHLRGEATLEETVEAVVARTRQYARRQLTWFRNQLPSGAVALDATRPLEEQVRGVVEAWEAAGGRPARGTTADEERL